ncbi:hypothetical protein [Nocardioides sp. P5_E3]
MPKIDVLKYDRTVDDEFLKYFLQGGVAESLLEYTTARYPIDFQFRKEVKSGAQWATVYVGMTAVLNILDKKSKGLALKTHDHWARASEGWSDAWSQPAQVEVWRSRWNDVEDYLEQVIPRVMTEKRFTSKEGVVQAAVSAFLGDSSRVILDREVVPSFEDTATKQKIRDQFSRPLAEAIEKAKPAPGKRPTKFGMECDALALDAAGQLVAVEVKPGNVGTLAWVAAQATMYARVLQHWVEIDTDWQATVTRMFGQRRALGSVRRSSNCRNWNERWFRRSPFSALPIPPSSSACTTSRTL